MSPWSVWSPCSAECDGGTMSRTRIVQLETDEGACDEYPLIETRQCNTERCSQSTEFWTFENHTILCSNEFLSSTSVQDWSCLT